MLQFPAKPVFTRLLAFSACAVLSLSSGCIFPTSQQGPLNNILSFSTVQLRFVNFVGDGGAHRFSLTYRGLGGVRDSTPTAFTYGQLTAYNQALRDDSTDISIDQPNPTSATVRFGGRNAVVTLLALPTPVVSMDVLDTMRQGNTIAVRVPNYSDTNRLQLASNRPRRIMDTVLVLNAPADTTPQASVRLRAINCVYDTRHRFDLALGCPSGDAIATGLQYRQSSPYLTTTLEANVVTVSLITRSTIGTTSIVNGSFNIPVQGGQSYSILIYRNSQGVVDILPINDRRADPISVTGGARLFSLLRLVNVSAQKAENIMYLGANISGLSGTDAGSVSGFDTLTACLSVGRDTVRLTSGGVRMNAIGSLTAGRLYSLLLGNDVLGAPRAVIAPVITPRTPPNMAALRCINFTQQPVSVLRGAVTGRAAQALAPSLVNGELSDTVHIPAGNLPLLFFSTSQPTRLLQTGIETVQAGQSYIAILAPPLTTGGEPRVYLVADVPALAMPMSALQTMTKGAFVQFVNAVADGGVLGLELGTGENFIKGVNLFYGVPQMTVLRTGESGISYTFASPAQPVPALIQKDRKYVLIFYGIDNKNVVMKQTVGLRDSTELLIFGRRNFNSENYVRDREASMYRFFNAAPDFGIMSVQDGGRGQITTNSSDPVFRPQPLGGITSGRNFNQSGRYDLTFGRNASTTNTITIRNLTFNTNRAYSIIFSGRTVVSIATTASMEMTTTNNYNAVILQEY